MTNLVSRQTADDMLKLPVGVFSLESVADRLLRWSQGNHENKTFEYSRALCGNLIAYWRFEISQPRSTNFSPLTASPLKTSLSSNDAIYPLEPLVTIDIIHRDILYPIFRTWSGFSGNITYPVPSGSDIILPRDKFLCCRDYWDHSTYGYSRRDLCRHTAYEIRKLTGRYTPL